MLMIFHRHNSLHQRDVGQTSHLWTLGGRGVLSIITDEETREVIRRKVLINRGGSPDWGALLRIWEGGPSMGEGSHKLKGESKRLS